MVKHTGLRGLSSELELNQLGVISESSCSYYRQCFNNTYERDRLDLKQNIAVVQEEAIDYKTESITNLCHIVHGFHTPSVCQPC